jgi:hypothetical protein
MPGDGNLMFALGREREKAKFTSNVAICTKYHLQFGLQMSFQVKQEP